MNERLEIAADLDRRADALFEAVSKMDTVALRQACYVAGTALRTAADHTRRGVQYHAETPLVVELVGPRLAFSSAGAVRKRNAEVIRHLRAAPYRCPSCGQDNPAHAPNEC